MLRLALLSFVLRYFSSLCFVLLRSRFATLTSRCAALFIFVIASRCLDMPCGASGNCFVQYATMLFDTYGDHNTTWFITVAIVAQGTLRADAILQAFFVAATGACSVLAVFLRF